MHPGKHKILRGDFEGRKPPLEDSSKGGFWFCPRGYFASLLLSAAAAMQQARDKALQPMYAFTYQFGESLTREPTRLERAFLRTIADEPKVTRRFFGISTGATDVRSFNRAAPFYLLRGLFQPGEAP